VFISRFFKRTTELKRKRYLKRLQYALDKLENPVHNDFAELDNRFRRNAIGWLINYYRGVPRAIEDGPPELKFKRLLSKPVSCIEVSDYVFMKVLYDWIEHKRVEGF